MSDTQTKDDKLLKNKKIAIFASGNGTNAATIIRYFKNHSYINISLIVSNNAQSGVLEIARNNKIEVLLIERKRFLNEDGYVAQLKKANIDFIVLAGFLWKIPQTLIDAFRNRIINIHPALLPKYGGKGMYGQYVHEAVINAGDKESGITIHYVDEHYDNGDIIFQKTCSIEEGETAESLANKIHQIEHECFSSVIEQCVEKL